MQDVYDGKMWANFQSYDCFCFFLNQETMHKC